MPGIPEQSLILFHVPLSVCTFDVPCILSEASSPDDGGIWNSSRDYPVPRHAKQDNSITKLFPHPRSSVPVVGRWLSLSLRGLNARKWDSQLDLCQDENHQ